MGSRPIAALPDTDDEDAFCSLCGSSFGQLSYATNRRVWAVYGCPMCMLNYCDQCSDKESTGGKRMPLCLSCGGVLEQVD